jgi:hypothetical protein
MSKFDIPKTRDLLQRFQFSTLFIEELGWSQPASRRPITFEAANESFLRDQIAELSGVVVFEITTSDGRIPDSKTRTAIHKQISKLHHENLLIFIDHKRTQSLWYWVKREDGKSYPREHWYFNGQPGDLFLSKLSSMVVDISEFDETGRLPIVEAASRLKKALDVEHVTKKFYAEFQEEHIAFLEYIKGIDDDRDRRWYASVMLNRLMFVYFLQRNTSSITVTPCIFNTSSRRAAGADKTSTTPSSSELCSSKASQSRKKNAALKPARCWERSSTSTAVCSSNIESKSTGSTFKSPTTLSTICLRSLAVTRGT